MQVQLAVDAIRDLVLRSTDPSGNRVEATRDRYAAFVWVAGRMGLRPEENIALRDGWVILDPADPRIELHGAEVHHARRARGRVRAQVPLKHCDPGHIRVVRPDPVDREGSFAS